MSDILVSIKCKKCNQDFQPDMKTRGDWICPACQTKNPNLRRHYRSVADLYILGLILVGIFSIVHFKSTGLDGNIVFSLSFAVLLLVTIASVYKSKTPWTEKNVKFLIWLVFGIALGFRLIQAAQMLLADNFDVPFMTGFGVVYMAIFIYLFWLHFQAKRYVAA